MGSVPSRNEAIPESRSRLPRRLALDQLILKRWRKPSLLIVDDEDDIRHLVRDVARFEGYERIWEAPDGETAIAMVYEHHPDVVVLDYRMPRMDGEAVAKCIRLLSPASVIIVFSAVLESGREWADLSFEKIQLAELVEALARGRALVAERAQKQAAEIAERKKTQKQASEIAREERV